MSLRCLVMGDNHGDVVSLEAVRDAIPDLDVDLAVHVGDFTDAMRSSRAEAVAQLEAMEPVLADIDDRLSHGLVWVWGNQDFFGDLDYDLDLGTQIPAEGTIQVAGRQFTSDLECVTSDAILVTHLEYWRLIDHFTGAAHFCGNTHRGRHRGNRLNAAFLKLTYPDTGETVRGGYFVVDVTTAIRSVECHPIEDLRAIQCPQHGDRGVQYRPSFQPCMYEEDIRALYRELAASAFYGLTNGVHRDAVADDALVEYAVSLREDPAATFAEEFRTYLDGLEDDRYAPLARAADGRLVLAENSYAY